MRLVVPPEIKSSINPHSGFIDSRSIYHDKSLKWLFKSKENRQYLSKEMYMLVTSEQFVKANWPDAVTDYSDYQGEGLRTGFNNKSPYFNKMKFLIRTFIKNKAKIDTYAVEAIYAHEMPHDEDLAVTNPVQQLHHVNIKFVAEAAKNIIQSPDNIIPNYYAINPDTGVEESHVEYDFNAESYSDGTWHPEHLFTNSERNRKNGYWTEINVTLDSDPLAKGPGHRYNNDFYHHDKAASSATSGIKFFGTDKNIRRTTVGQFPGWQYTVNKRPYDKHNDEGLRDGGKNDRRTQRPHGYDMTALTTKSTY